MEVWNTRGERGWVERVKSTILMYQVINYQVPHSRICLIQEERGRNEGSLALRTVVAVIFLQVSVVKECVVVGVTK